jgi:hypothetical protein
VLGTLVLIWNLIASAKRGQVAGPDPWDARTLEWSIPSPPPEYNFAKIPRVTSRYPMWDMKSPGLTAEVPHTANGDKRLDGLRSLPRDRSLARRARRPGIGHDAHRRIRRAARQTPILSSTVER